MEAPVQNSKGNVKGPLQYVCDECPLICESLIALRNHKRKHTGEKPYLCSICGKSFKRSCILDDHMRILHPKAVATDKLRLLKCSYCPKLCPSKTVLTYHERTHTGERPYKCGFCSKGFTFARNRQQHEKRVHNNVSGPVKVRAKLNCEICTRRFICQARLDIHLKIHAGKKPYKCDYCSEEFDYPSGKRMHEIRKHADQIPDFENFVKDLKCTWCGKIYPHKATLAMHVRSHTGDRPFNCDVCGKSFHLKQILKKHAKSHAKYGLKPLKCSFCDDRFKEVDGLRRHERKRHNTTLGSTSSYVQALKSRALDSKFNRMGSTSFAPPSIVPEFKCDKCKQIYFSRVGLRVHVCSGRVRVFDCEFCKLQLNSTEEIERHLEEKHLNEYGGVAADVKKIRCFWCPQLFESQVEANEHEKLHLPGENCFKCDQCDLRVSSQDDLDEHLTLCGTTKSPNNDKQVRIPRRATPSRLYETAGRRAPKRSNKNVTNHQRRSNEPECVSLSDTEEDDADSNTDEDYKKQLPSVLAKPTDASRRSQRSCVKRKVATDENTLFIDSEPEELKAEPRKTKTLLESHMTGELIDNKGIIKSEDIKEEPTDEIQVKYPVLILMGAKKDETALETPVKVDSDSASVADEDKAILSNQSTTDSNREFQDTSHIKIQTKKSVSANRIPLYRVHVSQHNQIEELIIESCSDLESETGSSP